MKLNNLTIHPRYKNWEWEPFFVSRNDVPLYDVLFPYQFRNHAEIVRFSLN